MPTFTQITPHIFKLDLPLFAGIGVGIFLIKHPDGWTVVDAGAPGQEATIFKEILALTKGEKPVRLILTHGHYDHGAAAQQMRDQWGVQIAAHHAEIPFLLGSERYSRLTPERWLLALMASPPALSGRNVQLPVSEGMSLDGFEVIYTPGHAPGHISLWHKADRALISGDAFMNLNNKLGDPFAMFTYDMPLNYRSQARLAQLDFDYLLVSHGPVIMNDGAKRAQAVVEKRGKKR